MARKSFTAHIIGHHPETGASTAEMIEKTNHVEISVPDLKWLKHIGISLNADYNGRAAVQITVELEDETRENMPRLTVGVDGDFMVKS